jgi:DNA-binding GntR family transcriptional regulator
MRAAIISGEVLPGTLLTEEPLANLVGLSRVPVRSAIKKLMDEGLLHRAGAHGYIVGPSGVDVIRVPVEKSLARLSILHEPRISFTWQTLYDEIEQRVVRRSIFGRARINEHELARHCGVGRTVARDVLSRLETMGMIEKDGSYRWSIVPLDERRILELYGLREHLEPLAISEALDCISDRELEAMTGRLLKGAARYPDISAAEMYDIEIDLHVTCVQQTRNREIAKALQPTHCLLTLSKHTVGTKVEKLPREAFFEEHAAIFEEMRNRNRAHVAACVRDHIRNSVSGVLARAEMVRKQGSYEPASFFT